MKLKLMVTSVFARHKGKPVLPRTVRSFTSLEIIGAGPFDPNRTEVRIDFVARQIYGDKYVIEQHTDRAYYAPENGRLGGDVGYVEHNPPVDQLPTRWDDENGKNLFTFQEMRNILCAQDTACKFGDDPRVMIVSVVPADHWSRYTRDGVLRDSPEFVKVPQRAALDERAHLRLAVR